MNTASAAPLGPNRPFVATGEHPIESTRYLLITPAVAALFAQVIQWVTNRVPGAVICGRPRRGKSKAIKLLIDELARVFPGMPVFSTPAFDRIVPNESAFLEKLLKEAGHSIVKRGDLEDKLMRLVEFLAQQADASGHGRVVLMIDEAQVLQERHYGWLIGLHNELDRLGVNLIVLLVGQHQLLQIRTGYITTEKHQIVGRFMVQVREFHGIRNADDVEACLIGYDKDSEYPVGSGWSFTRYSLPEWFDGGGRLSQLAQDFWSVISEVRKGGRAQADNQMPMQDFARTVEHFLRIASIVNPATFRPQYDLRLTEQVRAAVRAALVASGYVSALKLDWRTKK